MSYRTLSDQILTCLLTLISGIELQLFCGVKIESALEVEYFFPRIDLEEGITITTSLRHEANSLMAGYTLTLVWDGVHSNKQTKAIK